MSDDTYERLHAALTALCAREGGAEAVAVATGLSAGNLRQILSRRPLASGKPRGIGPGLRQTLGRVYPGWTELSTPSVEDPRPRGAVALVMSQSPPSYSSLKTWEELVLLDVLPRTFRVTMPDDSMVPRVRRGDIVEFQSDLQPRSGDGVLVRDRDGGLYFRIYRLGGAGHWEAHPTNPDFLPLLSERDGLSVAAVMTGLPQHRWG